MTPTTAEGADWGGTGPSASARDQRPRAETPSGKYANSPFPKPAAPRHGTADTTDAATRPGSVATSGISGDPAPAPTGRRPRPSSRRRGERTRGPSAERGEVRARISRAAREEFIEKGYDGTTMRSVARRAGCDSAMVAYYFGSKQRLFRECLNLPLDPAHEVIAQLSQGIDGAAERLLRYSLSLYETRLTGDTLLALMRALITDAQTGQRFRSYFANDILTRVTHFFGTDTDLGEQVEMVAAMMYGVATMRYAVRLEPLASMPTERLIDELAPLLQERLDRIVLTTRE